MTEPKENDVGETLDAVERHFIRRGQVYLIPLYGVPVVLLLLALWIVLAPSPWSPIKPFEQQTVEGERDRNGRVVVETSTVNVTGTKCYREQIVVSGAVSWQSIDPPGAVVQTGAGSAERIPIGSEAETNLFSTFLDAEGCITQRFENTVPDEVRAAEALGPRVWIITGTETPVRTDGSDEGVQLSWRTEEFRFDVGGNTE